MSGAWREDSIRRSRGTRRLARRHAAQVVERRQRRADTTGWCSPPDNVEFYLSSLFASVKENGGGRPALFDVAFLATRYRTEFAMLEMPAVVRRVVIPILYGVGRLTGRHNKYKGAPAPILPHRTEDKP